MEIRGKIIAVLPEQSGVSKAGNNWKKQEYILETQEQFARKVCFQFFGEDRIAQAAIKEGEELTVFFDIDSREHQGRWYTSISAWKVQRESTTGSAAPASSPSSNSISPSADFTPPPIASNDDLPF